MQKLDIDLLLNLELTLQDSIEDVERTDNSYTLDEQNNITAVSISHSDIEQLLIAQDSLHLKHLYLSNNENLVEIKFEISLPYLTHLYLNNCLIDELYLPEGFQNLKQLYVQKNTLNKMAFGGDCPELELIDLSNNILAELTLPDGFSKLKHFYLQNNRLEGLSESFSCLKSLETLYLSDNPLTNVPIEVVGTGNNYNSARNIVPYFSSLRQNTAQFLHEAKMILIGNPMVGKSSIRIKLKNIHADLPKIKDRTLGLDIDSYTLKNIPKTLTKLDFSINFQLNIWDFGGQGRYREVQQLFCSRKSLYLYVTSPDDKPGKEDYINFDYWKSMVNAYSHDSESNTPSPMIYVLNKIDIQDSGIDEVQSKKNYKNQMDFEKISCKDKSGIDRLVNKICQALPLIGNDVFSNQYNQNWFSVKNLLQNNVSKYILYKDYIEICYNAGLDDEQANVWLKTLDRIGTVVYTGDYNTPEDWVILDPIWLKDAICMIIDNPLIQAEGKLKEEYISFLGGSLTNDDWQNLIKLMLNEKYKLAYQVESNQGVPEYIVPSALYNKPKPSLSNYEHLLGQADHKFQFDFNPFLPAGILNKLIVAMNKYVYKEALIWGNGCIFHDYNTNTYVELLEDWKTNTIRAKFFGRKPTDFYEKIKDNLSTITKEIKATKFLAKLEFVELKEFNRKMIIREDLHDFLKDEEETSPVPGVEQIRNLIGDAELEDAINLLRNWVPESLSNDVILLKSRLKNLQKKEEWGTIDVKEANLERTSIAQSALSYCL